MKTIGKTVGGKTVRVREEPRRERQPAKRGAAPEPKPEGPKPEGEAVAVERPSVTLEDYRDAHGEIGEGDFKAALPAALGVVADLVGLNDIAGEEDAWKRAVLAVVAVDAAYGFSHGVGEGMASVTLGKFSASGGGSASGGSQWLSDARAAARRELAGTGLLYAGVPL